MACNKLHLDIQHAVHFKWTAGQVLAYVRTHAASDTVEAVSVSAPPETSVRPSVAIPSSLQATTALRSAAADKLAFAALHYKWSRVACAPLRLDPVTQNNRFEVRRCRCTYQ